MLSASHCQYLAKDHFQGQGLCNASTQLQVSLLQQHLWGGTSSLVKQSSWLHHINFRSHILTVPFFSFCLYLVNTFKSINLLGSQDLQGLDQDTTRNRVPNSVDCMCYLSLQYAVFTVTDICFPLLFYYGVYWKSMARTWIRIGAKKNTIKIYPHTTKYNIHEQ